MGASALHYTGFKLGTFVEVEEGKCIYLGMIVVYDEVCLPSPSKCLMSSTLRLSVIYQASHDVYHPHLPLEDFRGLERL